MIILFHGTGDDDTKIDNWMRWVAELCIHHGETVLVLPGVASSEYGQLFDKVQHYLARFKRNHPHLRRKVDTSRQTPPGLLQDITAAASEASEFRPLMGTKHQAVLQADLLIKAIRDSQSRHHRTTEKGTSAIGIKTRAALAAISAHHYYTHCTHEPATIRLIGHSRGGAAAIAAHNLLRWYGISNVRTVVLDACHGLAKLTAKRYTHVVYSGTVVSLPAVREVFLNDKWYGGLRYTNRQLITLGQGHDVDAIAYNHAKLSTVFHGHMGKLYYERGDQRNAVDQNLIAQVPTIRDSTQDARSAVARLFGNHLRDYQGDLKDKEIIRDYVLWGLFNQDGSVPWIQATTLEAAVRRGLARWRESHGSLLKKFTASDDSKKAAARLDALLASMGGGAQAGNLNAGITEAHLRYAVCYYLNCQTSDPIRYPLTSLAYELHPNGANYVRRLTPGSALYTCLRSEVLKTGEFM